MSRAFLNKRLFCVTVWHCFYDGPDGGANAQAKARRFLCSGLLALFGLPPRLAAGWRKTNRNMGVLLCTLSIPISYINSYGRANLGGSVCAPA